MSEQTGPFTEDTPVVAGPEGTPGAQDPPYGDPNDPYEKRYNDLRSWTDRTSQEASDLRREREEWQQERELYQLMNFAEDEDTRRQAAQALGHELEQELEQPYDPYDSLQEQYQRLEQRVDQRDQEAHENAQREFLMNYANEQLGQLPGDLDEEDQNWVLQRALDKPISQPPGSFVEAVPDIRGAYDDFVAWETKRQKVWAKTKRAPYVSPGGQTATEVPNLDTHQGRMDFAAQKLMELEER